MSLSTPILEWFLAFIKGWVHAVINMEGLERSATTLQGRFRPYSLPSQPPLSCALSHWRVGKEARPLGQLCRVRVGVPLRQPDGLGNIFMGFFFPGSHLWNPRSHFHSCALQETKASSWGGTPKLSAGRFSTLLWLLQPCFVGGFSDLYLE